MERIPKLLTEVGVVVTIGVGYFLLKQHREEKNSFYEEFPHIHASDFPITLDNFRHLKQDQQFQCLLSELETFLQMAHEFESKKRTVGQFQLNRIADNVNKRAKSMCIASRASTDQDVQFAAIDCERDHLDALATNCEIIFKNILLE